MYIDKSVILETIKMLSDIDIADHDNKISFAINKTVDEVKAFINCKTELPKALENVVTDITFEYLKLNPYSIKQFESLNMSIKSIERGDTSITYKDSQVTIVEIMENYKAKLLPYAKIRTL